MDQELEEGNERIPLCYSTDKGPINKTFGYMHSFFHYVFPQTMCHQSLVNSTDNKNSIASPMSEQNEVSSMSELTWIVCLLYTFTTWKLKL